MKFALIALALLLTASSPAAAHSKMSGSTPKSGETVAPGLDTLKLTFDRKVRLTVVDMSQAPDGMDLDSLMGSMDGEEKHAVEGETAVNLTTPLPKGFVDEASLAFEELETGVYMLHWIAVAMDGHTMKGNVHFAVGEQ
ncbi:MAG: copper resistance CopC family protein [Alphaproteobacteria bacterium]|jgi:methionine-rich copper-binding protein CopC